MSVVFSGKAVGQVLTLDSGLGVLSVRLLEGCSVLDLDQIVTDWLSCFGFNFQDVSLLPVGGDLAFGHHLLREYRLQPPCLPAVPVSFLKVGGPMLAERAIRHVELTFVSHLLASNDIIVSLGLLEIQRLDCDCTWTNRLLFECKLFSYFLLQFVLPVAIDESLGFCFTLDLRCLRPHLGIHFQLAPRAIRTLILNQVPDLPPLLRAVSSLDSQLDSILDRDTLILCFTHFIRKELGKQWQVSPLLLFFKRPSEIKSNVNLLEGVVFLIFVCKFDRV